MAAMVTTSIAAEIVLTQKKRLKFSGEFVAVKPKAPNHKIMLIANAVGLSRNCHAFQSKNKTQKKTLAICLIRAFISPLRPSP